MDRVLRLLQAEYGNTQDAIDALPLAELKRLLIGGNISAADEMVAAPAITTRSPEDFAAKTA